MNDTTLTAAERIHGFAEAVRAQLADLPADEVDDLVEGLVGDLSDQAADHGGQIDLGDPAAFAQELRDAALSDGLADPDSDARPVADEHPGGLSRARTPYRLDRSHAPRRGGSPR